MPVFIRTPSICSPYDLSFRQSTQFSPDLLITGANVYECTVTFDRRLIWTLGSIWDEGIDLIIEKILYWNFNNVKQLFAVVEYQKNLTPHVHMRLVSKEPIGADIRSKHACGLQRLFGRSSFKSVEHPDLFIEYLQKDLESNLLKYSFPHWCLITEF